MNTLTSKPVPFRPDDAEMSSANEFPDSGTSVPFLTGVILFEESSHLTS